MLDKLTSKDFSGRIGHVFQVQVDSQELLSLTLEEVNELGPEPRAGETRRRAFSLVFCSPQSDSYLPQQICQLEHQDLGTLDLFLVPLGPHPDGMRYEAIFT